MEFKVPWGQDESERPLYMRFADAEDEDSEEEITPEMLEEAMEDLVTRFSAGETAAEELDEIVDERTVNVQPELDEDAFFSHADGRPTIVSRYDLERAVPQEKKTTYVEDQRYWVNKPYSFVIIFHSNRENEKKYVAVEPHLTPIEEEVREFLSGKLRTSIKYADESITVGDRDGRVRGEVIESETNALIDRYDLRKDPNSHSLTQRTLAKLPVIGPDALPDNGTVNTEPIRPEPVVLEENPTALTPYQIEKLLYYFKRDFVGYERIDPIKHDINVEDISCDGWNSRVFVYHTDYEQLISNIEHGKEELDNFVVKLAQRSGKGISKRRPQVDATLPDGSRAQLTLGAEVSDHGTNYTIRQFKEVPFTPVDLINWKTFSLDQMAFLWLCIENNKSLLFAGGTASGKTTSLNAISLFIPSDAKIVSIEDTREVELPQRNWIPSVTRPSFTGNESDAVDEFDLLEAALRQRPDYIVMGEIRGEEGRTLFQVMSTGHTTYTTFHADSVGEVLKRFTTDPINVSKTMFTALDLVSIQTQTRIQGRKVRRSKVLTEINHYDTENDEINVQDIYQWEAESDEFFELGSSNVLEEIRFDRGWSTDRLQRELHLRKLVLSYLIDQGLSEYAEVAATVQAFINDPETVLSLIASDQLEESLNELREMESVIIDIDQAVEDLVPRPEPPEDVQEQVDAVLESTEELVAAEAIDSADDLADALSHITETPPADINTVLDTEWTESTPTESD